MNYLFLIINMLLCVIYASAAEQKEIASVKHFHEQTPEQKEFHEKFMVSWKEFMLSWHAKNADLVQDPDDCVSKRIYTFVAKNYVQRADYGLQVKILEQRECKLRMEYDSNPNASEEEIKKYVQRIIEINENLGYLRKQIKEIEKEL